MARRKRIGLIFSYNEEWIGGTYYILNIISALKTLPSNVRPKLVIISDDKENFSLIRNSTKYPHLEYFQYPFVPVRYSTLERAINKCFKLIGVKKFINKTQKQPNIDFLYPSELDKIRIKGLKKINWIPDFQEEFLPHFFSEKEINFRKNLQKEVACKGDFVVLSSEVARSHFTSLYPEAEAETFVLPFAVTLPDFSELNINKLRPKHGLPNTYFFVPNQFWAHKNHQVVIDAVLGLKVKGVHVVVAFSGKENDYRNKEYVSELKNFIEQNNMQEQILFLGFLDRKEQLMLMKHSLAIIQPSLFEGWSTVVEDAKALNKHIILSNIPVHNEQINFGVDFFDPKRTKMLEQLLSDYSVQAPITINYEYNKDRIKFGLRFMELVHLGSK